MQTCIQLAVLLCPLVMATGCLSSAVSTRETTPDRSVLAVDVETSDHSTSTSFLSVTISGGRLRNGLKGFDFSSDKLKSMAAALAPAKVRFGGTEADFLHFDPKSDSSLTKRSLRSKGRRTRRIKREENIKGVTNFTMPAARWDNLTTFCAEANWDIMWDFNLFFWKKGRWDPTFARKFLKYSAARGIKIPAFQLGNEPNLYENKFDLIVPAELLAANFERLKNLISEFPMYANSELYGPDTSNLHHANSARKYLASFLENGGCDLVDEVALHHYYIGAEEANKKDFLDPELMDNLGTHLDHAHDIILHHCTVPKPICLSETSSASGGGLRGVSDAYAAGFLWLDKLGLSAKKKVTYVLRQTFFDSGYSLIMRDQRPNPDFYLSVLYKRLIEGPVFHVDTSKLPTTLRLYANCVRKSEFYDYPGGALVVYYLNTAETPMRLSLGDYKGYEFDLFALTPGDDDGLKSKTIMLNDQKLIMYSPRLPTMEGKRYTSGAVPLDPQSYGFIVIPNADVSLCKKYHRAAKEEEAQE